MGEATMAKRMGTGNPEEGRTTSIVVDGKIAPWMNGIVQTVQLERLPATNGGSVFVGSISGLYPGSRKMSDRLNKGSCNQAYEAYKRFVEATAINPGLRAYDYLVAKASNIPTILVNLPRVFRESSLAGYGVHIVRANGDKREDIYLFMGGCRLTARDRFEHDLRQAGYERKKNK